MTQIDVTLDGIPGARSKCGVVRRRSDAVRADRGYDWQYNRIVMWICDMKPITPDYRHDGAEGHGNGLGAMRWVVERCNRWLRQHRRYERVATIHQAFFSLGWMLICLNKLMPRSC